MAMFKDNNKMACLRVEVAKDVMTRLSKETGVVFLLGWAEDTNIFCIGCVRDIDEWDKIIDIRNAARQAVSLFPAGIGIIGLYCPCSEQCAKEKSEELFNELLRWDIEEFIVGPLLAFIYQPVNDDECQDKNMQNFIYNTRTEKSVPVESSIVDSSYMSSKTVLLRLMGHVPLSFEKSDNVSTMESNIEKAVNIIKDQVSSNACVYHLQKSSLILSNSEENPYIHPLINANSKCGDLTSFIQLDDDEENNSGSNKKQKNKTLNSQKVLNVKFLFKTTGEDAIKNTISCAPIIRYERRDFTSVCMNLGIDMLVTVPMSARLLDLPTLFTNAVSTQLSAMQDILCKFYKEKGCVYLPKVYHFNLPLGGQPLNFIYPQSLSDQELEPLRQELHVRLLLPLDRPILRKPMQLSFADEQRINGYLRNVHAGLPQSGVTDGKVAVVTGTYTYHHYMQDHFDDNGWGCAYRSLQTLISWFVHQGYTDKTIPRHAEIQKSLVDIGDKPQSFVNSRKWIGSMEVSFCLDNLIGITSKIISVSSGSELCNKGRELVNHFEVQGTPIMIGGGVLAHTILGVHVNFQTGDIKFLVLDPHYTGAEDLAVIQGKGWCGWKDVNFWDKTAYYNLCCPQRPPGI